MPKELHFESDAQSRLLEGATKIAKAIGITLGPKSKSVLIEKKWGNPIVCNDGVTIAKEVELKDPVENMGARMIREVAERTGDTVGDGTSTSALIAHAIFSGGIRNVVAGASAIDIKRGLDAGLRIATTAIRNLSKKISSRQEKVQVATVSAHNDPVMGKLVADAIEKVGGEGVISVEEARGTETTVEVVEGMQFDRGYLSPYFVTDPSKMEVRLEHPYILVYDRKITSIEPIVPLLEQVMKTGNPFVFIAEEIEGEALAMLVVNKLRATLSCVAIKAPGFGDRKRLMLEDIAILTGAKLLTEEAGVKLEHITLDSLGRAERVVIDKDTTTIIGGGGEKISISERITLIKSQMEKEKSQYDREKLEERLAKLSGGVAVVRVGAPSETELKSRKEALDDAISATKAALAEGIVPGAGLALLRAAQALENEKASFSGDEKTGIEILKHALEIPTRQIAQNSNSDPGVVVNVMSKEKGSLGFDAAKREYVDLFQAGIIDPTKVVRIALENAVSVAGMLLLTQATLTDTVESVKKEDQSALSEAS